MLRSLGENKKTCILVGMTFGFFIFMMIYNLTHSPLWGDEWVEFIISQKDIASGEMYREVVGTYQPPLYNWLMHFWLLANNESILWFRLFNVVLGIISGLFLYLTQIRLFGNTLMACFSLLVLALCYQWIYAVQECSEYTLMITCLFVSIYFFCRYTETQGIKDEVFFILGCVGAMYSQYGAVFIVGPILMISLVYTLSRKNRIISIRSLLLYGISFIIFAIPLYFRYLRTQMLNNKIIEYAVKQFGMAEFKRLFGQFGLNIGYLWNLNLTILSKYIMVLVGIVFMLYLIITLIKNRANWKAWDMLILTLIIGYLVHYFLVIFHIYAMIHPDMSSGFYCRYSWFYIPVFAVIIPGSLYLLYSSVKPGSLRQAAAVGFTICMIIGLFPNIAKNWHKAYDDVFAEQWMERGGYQEPTYLCGAYYWEGFDTYVTKKYGESYKSQVYELSDLDPNQLPPVFWVWRTNWGGDVADELSVTAVAKGYHEEMVNGPAPLWQLIRYSI